MKKVIVSACLAGVRCRWDGKAVPCKRVMELVWQGRAILACPEQLGGLPTPRPPAEIRNGRAVTKDGRDLTENFQRGAKEALKIAQLAGCRVAVLKSKSPSCGLGKIYDGSFSRRLINGNGIFAALLKSQGIKVLAEEEI